VPRPQVVRQAAKKAPLKRAAASASGLEVPKQKAAAYRDLDEFVVIVSHATPYQLVELERHGVDGRFLKDLSKRMEIPQLHVFDMIGVPKATAEKKVAAGEVISGSGGQAAIGMAKLIAKAKDIVANSTAKEAKDFDAARWLGTWLEIPQPALGGRKPSELVDTPTGRDVVLKLLGAIESGAYQ
jgi:putative toxin-antitoxin system antitoxin component (TIGR02293 family)